MQQTNNLFRVLKPKPQWITTIGKPILDGGPCRRIRAYNFSSYTSEFANKKNKTQVTDHRQGKFKPSQTRSLFGNRVSQKKKGSLTSQRLNVLIVINMDTLPKSV